MNRFGALKFASLAIACGAVLGLPESQAQTQDRERAQMLQMQQQLQRLQSENATLQRDQAGLKQQAQDAERLKKESAQKSKEISQAQADTAAKAREIESLHADIEARNAQLEQWKKAVADRDAALREAADNKHRLDTEVALLGARLKSQTGRGDLCETKHALAMQVGEDAVDRYAENRTRWCEPVTGIWRVKNEDEIRKLRDRLYEARLDAAAAPAK